MKDAGLVMNEPGIGNWLFQGIDDKHVTNDMFLEKANKYFFFVDMC